MTTSRNETLFSVVVKILRPLVRILLRNGVPYGTFADLAKHIYVDLATKEFGISGRKQSVSRVSIITGLSRKEVSRVQEIPDPKDTEASERYNRAARVISGWARDSRFSGKTGQPADLPLEGSGATFAELVRAFSGDVPSRAILDELLRVGAVESLADGRVRLLTHAYVPRTEEAGKLDILGTDVRDLIRTIDHNLSADTGKTFFQRKVSYDNLPKEILSEFQHLANPRAQGLLEELDRWLSRHDRDTNPSVSGTGKIRAGLGIYYFEEESSEEGEKS